MLSRKLKGWQSGYHKDNNEDGVADFLKWFKSKLKISNENILVDETLMNKKQQNLSTY
jgi:hypothetical protein